MTLQNDAFTRDQQEPLRALAGALIPGSGDHGMPGADDPTILEKILAAAAREPAPILDALAELEGLARSRHGSAFAALGKDLRSELTLAFAGTQEPPVVALGELIAQCYYSDEGVLNALGMEPRPPFPEGYEVEQGDWSLLDPVKRRPKLYRPA